MAGLHQEVLDAIQSGFPLEPDPYGVLAGRLGATRDEVLATVGALRADGVIRRIGASFSSAKLGYSSTLCALAVPGGQETLDAAAAVVDAFPNVTHDYARDDARYNLWFTLITRDAAEKARILDGIRAQTGCDDLLDLPATALYKIRVDFGAISAAATRTPFRLGRADGPSTPCHPERVSGAPTPRHPERVSGAPTPCHPERPGEPTTPRHPERVSEAPTPRHPERPGEPSTLCHPERSGEAAQSKDPASASTAPSPVAATPFNPGSAFDVALVRWAQGDIADGEEIDPEPFQSAARCIAAKLGDPTVDEARVLARLRGLKAARAIRRFGAMVAHRKAGFTFNGMTVWDVPEAECDQVGKLFAGFPFVSHCYARPRAETWPYTLYAMVHAKVPEELEGRVKQLEASAGISARVLVSTHEYKKISMRYFE